MSLLINPSTKIQTDMFVSSPSHGLGLSGEKGFGKQYLAKNIAARILGLTQKELEINPYYKTIHAGGKEGIDSVRELQRFLLLKVPGKAKIKRGAIVTDIELFRHEAQNALLKTLEEPPEDTLIIVTTSDKARLLDTIKSRLQWVAVKPIDVAQAKTTFSSKYSASDVDKAWLISQGGAGLLTSLLENDDGHPLVGAITYAKTILGKTSFERLAEVERITKDKTIEIDVFLDAAHRLLYSAMQQAIKRGAAKKEINTLKNRVEQVMKARDYARLNVQPKLLLTNLFYSL